MKTREELIARANAIIWTGMAMACIATILGTYAFLKGYITLYVLNGMCLTIITICICVADKSKGDLQQ